MEFETKLTFISARSSRFSDGSACIRSVWASNDPYSDPLVFYTRVGSELSELLGCLIPGDARVCTLSVSRRSTGWRVALRNVQ